MIPAARFALLPLALLLGSAAPMGWAQTAAPPEVQHFGPLVVVATHDESPDPDTLRGDLFSQKKSERRRFLHAIGVDTIPEVQKLWQEFLADHPGKEDEAITQFASGGELEIQIGAPGVKQVDVSIGFETVGERPLELTALYERKDGRWTHVATLACRCAMGAGEDPFNLYPDKPRPPAEWVISMRTVTAEGVDFQDRDIRFRLRDGILWPLIDFVSRTSHCPNGVQPGAKCQISVSSLDKALLIDEAGKQTPGFVVHTRSGTVATEKKVPLMENASSACMAYLWNKEHFAYEKSSLKPVKCGWPDPPHTPQAAPHRKSTKPFVK